MRPGEIIRIVKGEFQGHQALVRTSDAFFYHLEVLYPNEPRMPKKIVTLHRSHLAPLEN